MNNFVYVYSPDPTRLTNPLIILCWRRCESASFPSKWLAADGQPVWLVFSGDDSFSIRRATLQLVSD